MSQIVQGPQIQSFSFECCLLTWRRASENVDCVCYPKIYYFWKLHLNKMCSFVCLKAKNKEKLKKNIYPFIRSKTNFPILCLKKFSTNFRIFLAVILEVKGRYFQFFNKKYQIFFFKGPCNFLKAKTLPCMHHERERKKFADFLELDS